MGVAGSWLGFGGVNGSDVESAFGRMKLDEFGPEDVAAWFDAANPDTPGAANRALEILRAMMFRAEEAASQKWSHSSVPGAQPDNNVSAAPETCQ